MEWNGTAVHHDSFPLRVVRFEDEKNIVLATKCQLPPRDREYFRKSQDGAVEMFSFVQVIHVQRGFQYAMESGSSGDSPG